MVVGEWELWILMGRGWVVEVRQEVACLEECVEQEHGFAVVVVVV